MKPTDAEIEDRLRDAIAKINKHGLTVVYVFDPQNKTPPFGYSAGLTGRDHPEFITFGLPVEATHWLINHLGDQVVKGERQFRAGDRVTGLLEGGYELELVEVAFPENHLTVAKAIYDSTGAPVRALQIVWPDLEHRFPWDEGYGIERVIPLLGNRT